MKKLICVLLVIFTISTISAQTKIDLTKSKINWIGKKITGEHKGTINFKEGSLLFKDQKISGGTFIADMTTLTNTDQSGKDKEKLEGHLKSDDFFNTKNFTTSQLVFKSVSEKSPNSYSVTADLTIKGKTRPITFDLLVKGQKATAYLKIDRTQYGIQYGSGSFFDDLGDRTIYDIFELNVELYY